MDGFCRACLVKFTEPSDLYQYSEKNRRLFIYSTGLQVKRNDYIVFQMCKICYNNMKGACNFKKSCRNSDKKLRSYFSFKEEGDYTDFSTFLKNNDDTIKFRLPMNLGASTPANQRRDDDNESTCTSIQNFMTDILPAEEIPDNEARIIREVIEEEADVLEDSLDSHWLQDDISIDTDFRLDLSFSPFSTPRLTNDDHCYTPREPLEDISQDVNKNCDSVTKVLEDNYKTEAAVQSILENNFEIDRDENNKLCTIDVNLDNALKNEDAETFALDSILATPPVRHDISAPPTPFITDILFGDKIDDKSIPDMDDVIDEFLNVNKTELIHFNNDEAKEIKLSPKLPQNLSPKSPKISSPKPEGKITNFYCKACERQFKSMRALKIHCAIHKRVKKERKMICDYCGKVFATSRCIAKHIMNHMKPQEHVCKYCLLSFSASNHLKLHLSTHIGKKVDPTKEKKHVCTECGKGFASSSNYHTHVRRHGNKHTHKCVECGMGFYRTSDLNSHMRRHTKERPFDCIYCSRSFTRSDSLNRHIKRHTGEKPHVCEFCDAKFVDAYRLKTHQNTKECMKIQQNIVNESAPVGKVSVQMVEFVRPMELDIVMEEDWLDGMADEQDGLAETVINTQNMLDTP